MRDEIIFMELNKHLRVAQQNYPYDNILGIFITDDSDIKHIKSEVIIIPTFEDMCCIPKYIECKSGMVPMTYLDIRKVYKATAYGYPETKGVFNTKYYIINPKYEHLVVKLIFANKDSICAGVQSGVPADELKLAITKICRLCWNEGSNAVKFIKQLTDAEKLALEGIVRAIGDEGTCSQYKVASSVGVSRLTMSNLIMKMKSHEVAQVNYLGKQGTYIKIIDDTLLNIRGI